MKFNILSCFKKTKTQSNKKISVGDEFLDKQFGDTRIKITKISYDVCQIRYIFLFINGKSIFGSGAYSMSVLSLKEKFLPVTQSAAKSS